MNSFRSVTLRLNLSIDLLLSRVYFEILNSVIPFPIYIIQQIIQNANKPIKGKYRVYSIEHRVKKEKEKIQRAE